jgi:predicted RNase H-like HicB family nuclease
MPHAYALIHEEKGSFGVSFPDFPGCISAAKTIDDVVRKGSEALSFHVAGMVEDGDPVPPLRKLAELNADPEFRVWAEGAVLAVVPFELPGKSVRVNISIDEHLLEAVDRAAQAVGQSRSAYLAEAARQRVKAA